jgi:hypothetical protein
VGTGRATRVCSVGGCCALTAGADRDGQGVRHRSVRQKSRRFHLPLAHEAWTKSNFGPAPRQPMGARHDRRWGLVHAHAKRINEHLGHTRTWEQLPVRLCLVLVPCARAPIAIGSRSALTGTD